MMKKMTWIVLGCLGFTLFGILAVSAVYPPTPCLQKEKPPAKIEDVLERLRQDELCLADVLKNLQRDELKFQELMDVRNSGESK